MQTTLEKSPTKMPKLAIDKFIAKHKNKFRGFKTTKSSQAQRNRMSKTGTLASLSYSITSKSLRIKEGVNTQLNRRSLSKNKLLLASSRKQIKKNLNRTLPGQGNSNKNTLKQMLSGKKQVKKFRKFKVYTRKEKKEGKGYSEIQESAKKAARMKVKRSARSLEPKMVQPKKFAGITLQEGVQDKKLHSKKAKGRTSHTGLKEDDDSKNYSSIALQKKEASSKNIYVQNYVSSIFKNKNIKSDHASRRKINKNPKK